MSIEAKWSVQGDFFESCNCDYLGPCVLSGLSAPTPNGHCNFVFLFQVEPGNYVNVGLDGLNFAMVGGMPGDTADAGHWFVGLMVEERVGEEQQQALTAVATGQA